MSLWVFNWWFARLIPPVSRSLLIKDYRKPSNNPAPLPLGELVGPWQERPEFVAVFAFREVIRERPYLAPNLEISKRPSFRHGSRRSTLHPGSPERGYLSRSLFFLTTLSFPISLSNLRGKFPNIKRNTSQKFGAQRGATRWKFEPLNVGRFRWGIFRRNRSFENFFFFGHLHGTCRLA